jgi:hypothetical protein
MPRGYAYHHHPSITGVLDVIEPGIPPARSCKHCGKDISNKLAKAIYCSTQCKNASNRPKPPKLKLSEPATTRHLSDAERFGPKPKRQPIQTSGKLKPKLLIFVPVEPVELPEHVPCTERLQPTTEIAQIRAALSSMPPGPERDQLQQALIELLAYNTKSNAQSCW